MKICRKANLMLNNDNCHFRFTSIPSFWEIISQDIISPDPKNLKALMKLSPSACSKELQSLLGAINYLSRFSPATLKVFEPLRKLTLVKAEWSWNGSYQDLYNKAERAITRDVCIPFYNVLKAMFQAMWSTMQLCFPARVCPA